MSRKFVVWLSTLMLLGATALSAEDDKTKELNRVKAANDVLQSILTAPDKGIPEEILAKARCVAVIPSMLNGGFIFGARYGKGVATCRTAHGWSAPAPIQIKGGSWGAQIGGEAVDLVMLIMSQKGMDNLLASKFKIGADVSGAAGPIGRHAEASTDWRLKSEVLTYSRARGAFAGITLNGAALTQDSEDTRLLYGREVPFARILRGAMPPPPGTQDFVQTVARAFREAKQAESAKAEGSGGVSGATTAHSEVSQPAPPQSVAATASQSAGKNPDAGTPTSDAKQVQQDVAAVLKDQLGNEADSVVIAVNANTIRLSGTVSSNDVRDKVVSIAQSKAGDRKVDTSGLKVK